MNNTNFIEVQGLMIRISDISLISDIIAIEKENEEGQKEFSHYQFKIVLNSGYIVDVNDCSENKLCDQIKVLLEKIYL